MLQLTYELRPKWYNNNKRAKMPFLGRTLSRGPTNINIEDHMNIDINIIYNDVELH